MLVIVIVVGMPGSGKDVLLQSAIELGYGHTSMGDAVRNYANKSGLDATDQSIGGFASSERQKHGAAIWAERTLESMPDGNVIIDGSRSIDEINLFRKKLGNDLKVIAVLASQELRFRRLQHRRREDDPDTLEGFIRRDNREMTWGIGKAIECADIAIENNAGLEEFRMQCQVILKSILDGDCKSI